MPCSLARTSEIAVCLLVAFNQHGDRAVNENQHNTNAAIMRVVEVIIDVRKKARSRNSMLTFLRASSRMQCEQLFQDGKQAPSGNEMLIC